MGRALLAAAAALAAGLFACAADDNLGPIMLSGDYELGGQTGSLVPGCGLAPLSAAGNGVPAGDALGVVYTDQCPDPKLALAGGGAIQLELVPLEREDVFLVRAGQSSSEVDYSLALDSATPEEIHVQGASALPLRLPELRAIAAEPDCAESLRFELPLDEALLAYAPLTKFELRMDRGASQLWIDYGALPIESDADGSVGVFVLPRCSEQGCLSFGSHQLELRAQVAGEALQPEPTTLSFGVSCPGSGTDDGCSLAGVPRSSAPRGLLLTSAALGCFFRRWQRRRLTSTARGA